MTKMNNDKKGRILLIDDESDITYLVKVGLERNGFEVDGYTDPILALQSFKAKKKIIKSKFAFSQHQRSFLLIIKAYSITLRISSSLYQNRYRFLK